MVDGLSPKPFATGIKRKSLVKSSPSFQKTGMDQFDFAEQRRQEIEADRVQRQAEQQATYDRQMAEYQQSWDRIYGIEKKMEYLADKIRKSVDPSKMVQEKSRLHNMKWKVHELYNSSLLSVGNALSTVLQMR